MIPICGEIKFYQPIILPFTRHEEFPTSPSGGPFPEMVRQKKTLGGFHRHGGSPSSLNGLLTGESFQNG